jgi:hypothetical protein
MELGNPILSGGSSLAQDILESVNNVLKTVATAALAPIEGAKTRLLPIAETLNEASEAFSDHAKRSVVSEARRLGDRFGPGTTLWARRLILLATATGGAPTLTHWIIQRFPSTYGWLEPIIGYINKL